MNSGSELSWSMLSVLGPMTFNDTIANIRWLIFYSAMLGILLIDDNLMKILEKSLRKLNSEL